MVRPLSDSPPLARITCIYYPTRPDPLPDFCIHTDPHLKTPLRQDQARTLLISSFSVSIACTLRGLNHRCPVCGSSAAGLFDALRAMPKLKSVRIEQVRHTREWVALMDANPDLMPSEPYRVDPVRGRSWWALEGEAVRGLRVSAEFGGVR